MGQTTNETTPFFRRLAKDVTANTLAISAASLVPLMAMVGGAVDASRFYMAQSRLQAACDAGALAARRAMDNNDFNDGHRTVGTNFFDNNYQDGLFGLEGLQRDYQGTNTGEVRGSASGDLPTTIMAAFGFEDFSIDVACQADINIADTDIMLVLDVTGSMAWEPDGDDCGQDSAGRWIECSNSRISALRTAVGNFYDTIEVASSSNADIRYGIVPYSQQVNVGGLLNASWLKTTHQYESRETLSTFTPDPGGMDSTEVIRTSGSTGSFFNSGQDEVFNQILPDIDDCQAVLDSRPGHLDVASFDLDNDFTFIGETSGTPDVTVYEGSALFKFLSLKSADWDGTSSQTNRRCEIRWDIFHFPANAQVIEVEDGTLEWDFRYGEVPWDISSVYSNGGTVDLPTGPAGVDIEHRWDGCVEMPRTVNSGGTFNPVPSGAFDLDIDLVPTTDDQKWAPFLETVNYRRILNNSYVEQDVTSQSDFSKPGSSCPKPARQLAEFNDKSELTDYLSAAEDFVPDGSTYLDIGMIWGAKLISPDGIFASENATASDGSSISRHIVFMTDGEAAPNVFNASSYGTEFFARRITTDGLEATALANHEARLQAACRAARGKNITVWVVAFGETFVDSSGTPVVPDNLENCATPGRAYVARNETQLETAFQDIAEKIADLRLTE